MTATATNYGYCTACGQYHAPSTACPQWIPNMAAPPYRETYTPPMAIVVSRDAEILAALERIEKLLERLLSSLPA